MDAPPARRNARALLDALTRTLPADGTVLEIGCGPGQHAAAFAHPLAPRRWLPTDPQPDPVESAASWADLVPDGRNRPLLPRTLDVTMAPDAWPVARDDGITALFSANVIHITPWAVTEALFAGAAFHLSAGGRAILYGPFRRNGDFTGDGDRGFDAWLKEKNPDFGVRDLEGDVTPLAGEHGFALVDTIAMPANNLLVAFEKR